MAGREPRITVHGVTGGQVENSNVAGINYGGMSNQNRRTGATFNQCTNAAETQSGPNTFNMSGAGGQTAAQVPKKDAKKLSPAELQSIQKEHHCPDTILKIFADKNVDGLLFLDLDDSLLDDLNVADKIERRRLLKIKDELKGQ